MVGFFDSAAVLVDDGWAWTAEAWWFSSVDRALDGVDGVVDVGAAHAGGFVGGDSGDVAGEPGGESSGAEGHFASLSTGSQFTGVTRTKPGIEDDGP